jgi:hypothetical protein
MEYDDTSFNISKEYSLIDPVTGEDMKDSPFFADLKGNIPEDAFKNNPVFRDGLSLHDLPRRPLRPPRVNRQGFFKFFKTHDLPKVSPRGVSK